MTSDKLPLLDKAGNVLEWPSLLERLAERAASELGAGACRNIKPAIVIESVRRSLGETSEMADLLREEGAVPVGVFEDLRSLFERAQKGVVPEPGELGQLAAMLERTRLLRNFFKNMRDECPLLWERAQALDEQRELKKEIDRTVDQSGKLRENATPELRRLTRRVRDKRASILKRLEQFMQSEKAAPYLQDEFYTQRSSRYVIPIKAEYRSKVEGIVHDSSNSGQTLFIEPRRFINANNQLKMAEMEVEQEAQRILRELGEKVGEAADILRANIEILTELDVIYAKARLSLDLNGMEPEVNASGRIDLIAARHPLLSLSYEEVVPNDVKLEEDLAALVISGPNTGGKTVTLKMVGLFALMVRAGLHLPADAGSKMALFPEVYADIGDEQDIARHLSTFSGHILNIIGIIGAASPGSLVLLDELVTSTDPAEGSAIAEAVLNRLAKRGAKVIATTHYAQLKAYAQAHPRFANASVEFDHETLTPTYRLIMGVPGRSSAIEITSRLGMVQDVIDRAAELISGADRRIEDMLESLETQKQALMNETKEAQQIKESARRLADENESVRDELRKKEREFKSSVKTRIKSELESARSEIQDVLKSLTKERTRKQALDSRKRLRELEERYKEGVLIEGEAVDPEQLRKGDLVVISHLGVAGELMEELHKDGKLKSKVKVRIGRVPMVVPTDSLRIDPAGVGAGLKPAPTDSHRASSVGEVEFPGTRLDLRGYRADDAVDEVERFLDRATLAQIPQVEIIHGHGTGALKKSIREFLDRSHYVESWKPAEIQSGGDGVTIVKVRQD